MKNIKKLFILILSLFLIFAFNFANVYAGEEEPGSGEEPGTQEPSEPSEPEEPTPQVTVSLDTKEATIEVGKTLNLTAIIQNQGESDAITWSSSDPSVASVEDAVVTAKKAGKATITVTVGEASDTCVVTVKAKEETKPVKATLKKVTIKGATVEKVDENTYNVTITDKSIFKIADDGEHVIVQLSDNSAKYSMTSLDARNEFKILVGDNTYTFKVITEAANVNLSSLKITGQSFNQAFDKDTTSYTLTVPYNINEVEIKAEAEDSNASITGTGYKDLPVGSTSFTITVTNGSEKKVYKIFVTREEDEEDTTGNKKKTKKVITNKNTSNEAEFDIPDVDNPDSTLNMTIITIGSLILFISGCLGIYFFFKTSPKRMKKELLKKKKNVKESPIVEIESTNNTDNIIDNDDIV